MNGTIPLDDFKKISLRMAKILAVDEIAGADRLWKLTIDAGLGPKTIVAGIKKSYPQKETLIGRNLVVVDNLEPAVIRGVESQGMLLAAKENGTLSLLTADKPDISPGSAIG